MSTAGSVCALIFQYKVFVSVRVFTKRVGAAPNPETQSHFGYGRVKRRAGDCDGLVARVDTIDT